MKKIICAVICILLLLSFASFGAFAVSINDGMDAMCEQFQSGESRLDYVFYSPVKDEDDTTKYPLVVWLHGNASGNYPGHQARNSCIYNWTSEEYQARFEGTHGAYLLLPRSQTGRGILAWNDDRILPLKKTIDAFIDEHKDTIDTSRIYIGGYSLGGKMCVQMAARYSDFFAAAFPMSPVYEPSTVQLNNLAGMPVWLFVNEKDTYITLNYDVAVMPRWNYLMSHSVCREKCRLTTAENFWHSEGVINTDDVHNTWDAVTYDMFMKSGEVYYDTTTVDGNGDEITLTYPNGVISWLSAQSIQDDAPEININFVSIIFSFIRMIFQMIF